VNKLENQTEHKNRAEHDWLEALASYGPEAEQSKTADHNRFYLELIPKALSRTALAAVNARKTVASAKTAHLKSLFWDRLLELS